MKALKILTISALLGAYHPVQSSNLLAPGDNPNDQSVRSAKSRTSGWGEFLRTNDSSNTEKTTAVIVDTGVDLNFIVEDLDLIGTLDTGLSLSAIDDLENTDLLNVTEKITQQSQDRVAEVGEQSKDSLVLLTKSLSTGVSRVSDTSYSDVYESDESDPETPKSAVDLEAKKLDLMKKRQDSVSNIEQSLKEVKEAKVALEVIEAEEVKKAKDKGKKVKKPKKDKKLVKQMSQMENLATQMTSTFGKEIKITEGELAKAAQKKVEATRKNSVTIVIEDATVETGATVAKNPDGKKRKKIVRRNPDAKRRSSETLTDSKGDLSEVGEKKKKRKSSGTIGEKNS